MVLVEAIADSGQRGLGFTYGAAAAATLIREMLAQIVIGCPVEHVGAAWDAALAADRPVLLEMVVDPNVPPAPPHLTSEQVRAYAMAMLKGNIKTAFRLRD